jgi:hypothetical protein
MDNKILIKALLAGGVGQVEIAEFLTEHNDNSHLEEALNFLHETANTSKGVKLSVLVRDWVEQQEGWFTLQQLSRDIPGLTTANRDMIISRLKKDCVIEADGTTAGRYRRINGESDLIDWQHADLNSALDLEFPFRLEDYCLVFPGNVIVVAGSGNAGKSAFMLDFARRNMNKYKTVYFSSEMGDVELAHRIHQFEENGIISITDWNVEFRDRLNNFADVIQPDAINIIDYMEITDKFYLISGMILDVWKKLNHNGQHSGLAVISLQKKSNVDIGRGGEGSMEKARLYLNMDYNKLTIKKAKAWKQHDINPNGMYFTFKGLRRGCEFVDIQRWDAVVE